MHARTLPLGLLALALAACRGGGSSLDADNSKVGVSPLALGFGSVYLQATPVQSFTVFNAGGGVDSVGLSLIADGGSGFTLDAGGFPLPGGGSVQVAVGFTPALAGPSTAEVRVAWSNGSAEVALTGNGLAWPSCEPKGACASAAFDPNTGSCNQSPLADGAPCDGGVLCLQNTQCLEGACLGQPLDCDDGNVCVTPACVEGVGCEYQDDSARCQGTDPCQIYSCDPVKGCRSSTAPDGTPCASIESCQTATVCVRGACLGVSVPNGTPCSLWWAPCVTDSACDAGACDSPTADQYHPGELLWSAPGTTFGSVAIDDGGSLYFVNGGGDYEWSAGPIVALDGCGNKRWDSSALSFGYPIVGYGPDVMLDGDQLIALAGVSGPGKVIALSTATGALLWSVDVNALQGCPPCDGGDGWMQNLTLAMSNQGLIYALGNYATGDGGQGRLLLALSRDGSVDWLRDVSVAPGESDNELAVDGAGNSYDVWTLSDEVFGFNSFDSNGDLRFMVTSPADNGLGLTVGANELFDSAGGIGWSPTGNFLFQVGGSDSTAVIDGAGLVYVALINQQPGPDLLLSAVEADGTLRWSAPLVDGWPTVPVLGDDELFAVGDADAGLFVAAWDPSSGQALWSQNFPNPGNDPYEPFYPFAALSGTGMLIVPTAGSIDAVFVGPRRPSANAPWSRWRGDNRNRSCGPAAP